MKSHKRVVEVAMEVTRNTYERHSPWITWRWAVYLSCSDAEVDGTCLADGFVPTEEAAWAAAVRCAESLGPLATPAEVTP